MKNIVAGVFKDNASAQDAVSELLLAGFTHEQIQIRSKVDLDKFRHEYPHAVARPRTENMWLSDFFRSLVELDDKYIWEKADTEILKQGEVVVMVNASSEERADRAAETMNHYSPRDVEELYTMSDVDEYLSQRTELHPSEGAHEAGAPEMQGSSEGQSIRRRGKAYIFSQKS